MYALPPGRESMPGENLFFIFRYKRLIGTVALTAIVVATLGVFLIAPTYEATTQILLKTDDRAKTAVSAGDASPAFVSRTVSYEEMLSHAAVLTSIDFLIEVVKTLAQNSSGQKKETESAFADFLETAGSTIRAILRWPFTLIPKAYNALHGVRDTRTSIQKQAGELKEDLTVATGGGSNVLQITYEHEDPVRAARVANAMATTFLEYYSKIYMPNNAEKFFSDQTQDLREKLTAAEAAAVAFHQKHNVFDSSTQRNGILVKLADFEAQLKTVRAEISAEKEKSLALKAESDVHPQQIPSSASEEPDPVITQIKTNLLNLEVKRDELLTRYTPTSSTVKEVDSRITQVKKMLAAEDSKTKRTTTSLNPVYQTLETQLALSRGQLAALEAREAVLASHVENYWSQLSELDTHALELTQLEREVERNRDAYARYVAKHEEARISTALDQSKIVNLSIVETAQVPFEPTEPKKILIILIAGVLGLVTGLGVAFVRDRFDSTVRTPREIEVYAGLPVLTTLPQRQLSGPVSSQSHVLSLSGGQDPSAT